MGIDAAFDFPGRIHKPMAKELAKLLEAYRQLFIKDPLFSEQSEGIKRLSELTTTPIALSERTFSL